jgi:hypothetical protein
MQNCLRWSGRQSSALPGRCAPYTPPPVALVLWWGYGLCQALRALFWSVACGQSCGVSPHPFGPPGRSFVPHIAPALAHPFPLPPRGRGQSLPGRRQGRCSPCQRTKNAHPVQVGPARFSGYSAGNVTPRVPDRAGRLAPGCVPTATAPDCHCRQSRHNPIKQQGGFQTPIATASAGGSVQHGLSAAGGALGFY